MKRILLTLFVMLTMQWAATAQVSFSTGKIGLNLSKYGRVRVLNGDGTVQQIDRSSLLIAKSNTEVFDYDQDAESIEPPVLITNPAKSDYEAYCKIDNSYSSLPPAVDVKIHVYGWNDKGYLIAKFNIISKETAAMNPIIGIEMIPKIDSVYGNEIMKYYKATKVVEMSKGSFVGYKILGKDPGKVNLIEWYDGYNVDTSYYSWMNATTGDTVMQTGPDGGVAFLNQPAVPLPASDSTTFYVAIALGSSYTAMMQNIADATAKFPTIVAVDDNNVAVRSFALEQNYPNPFNPETIVRYSVANKGQVSLKVFDLLGNEVATLVNKELAAGSYTASFNGAGLASGVYVYRLQSGTQSVVRKMVLMK